MRGLSDFFLNQLENGIFLPLLDLVRRDLTLCMEIREGYFNIYYRGGNLLRVEEEDGIKGVYIAKFDKNYIDKSVSRIPNDLPKKLISAFDVEKWILSVPFLKNEMDLWFGRNPKNEREFQQLVVRENNLDNRAKSTDYFICDIEYANDNGRFDLIAVRWPSSGSERKKNTDVGFAFIEMKYGDSALAGNAGLKEHLQYMNEFLSDPKNLSSLKNEMRYVFNQMRRLKLIDNQKDIEQFNDEKPEYIFILANHDRDSSILRREMEGLRLNYPHLDLKFAVSNFMGYGLYKQNVYSLKEFLSRFKDQI